MNKLLLFSILLIFSCVPIFSKELEGKNIEAVNLVLETNLQTDNFENLDEKIVFIDSVKKQIEEYGDELSDEAKMICFTSLEIQKINLKSTEALKKEREQKKKQKREKNPEAEAFVMKLYNDYKDFGDSHTDLSAHYYFHLKEIEFVVMPYLSTGAQIKILQNIKDDYQKIEDLNPNYGENLYYYGMVLYMMPKFFGGDKKAAVEKIIRATEVSATKYEKISSITLYSQILFEDKKNEEAKQYLEKALSIVPDSKTVLNIKKMNDAGYSMFQAEEYEKNK